MPPQPHPRSRACRAPSLHPTATRRHGAWLGTVHGNGRPIWRSPLTATRDRALQLARQHIAALGGNPAVPTP